MKSREPQRDVQKFVALKLEASVRTFLDTSFFDVTSMVRAGAIAVGAFILLQSFEPICNWLSASSNLRVGGILALRAFVGLSVIFVLYKGLAGFQKHSLAKAKLHGYIKREVIRFWNPELEFNAKAEFPTEFYKKSGIFPSRPVDWASCEDQLTGKVNNTPFYLSEIYTREKKEYRDGKGRKRTRWVDLFKGLLFVADCNKNFSGYTILRNDLLESRMGWLGKSLQRVASWRSSLETVDLEDPLFEASFKVQSSDPVEARFLISSTFMEQVLKLEKVFGSNMQICFIEAQIAIAIPYPRNFLDASLNFRSLESSVSRMTQELDSFIKIIETLKLNQEIWNKKHREPVKVA